MGGRAKSTENWESEVSVIHTGILGTFDVIVIIVAFIVCYFGIIQCRWCGRTLV